jgi:hypothetical protein
MTPKEKAKELFKKFTEVDGYDFNIKQCALIAVDEILKELLEMVIVTGSSYVVKHTDYWEEIKQEIKNL